MNNSKVNYILESLRMTEEVEGTDSNGNPTIKRVYTITGESRTLLVNELVAELTTPTT
ncbi:MAG: hypothetical protein ACOCX0_01010 [Bacteroidota bacterium]